MRGAAFLEKLIDKAIDTGKMGQMNWILNLIVPFNRPHGIRVSAITRSKVTAYLPYKRRNFNHLKGIHACALCTLGEFPAGILLISKFSFKDYRLILADLNAEYHQQARTDLTAVACWPEGLISKEIQNILDNEEHYSLPLKTKITDKEEIEVATITTTWQLKAWEKVNLK